VNQTTGISKPWTENPMGISAILIPPPCPKRIRGKGVVTDVIVDDPGNGLPRPGTGGYPVTLRLKNIVVEDILVLIILQEIQLQLLQIMGQF
jgi:hypothetical protein